jgi:hypothetical protein
VIHHASSLGHTGSRQAFCVSRQSVCVSTGLLRLMGIAAKPDIKPLLDSILAGDCLEQLRKLPTGSVDLVFADPPYNLQLGGGLAPVPTSRWSMALMMPGTSSTRLPPMTRSPAPGFAECRRVLKPTGTLWVIGSYHNIFRVGARCRIWASGSSTTSSGARPTRCRISAAPGLPMPTRR